MTDFEDLLRDQLRVDAACADVVDIVPAAMSRSRELSRHRAALSAAAVVPVLAAVGIGAWALQPSPGYGVKLSSVGPLSDSTSSPAQASVTTPAPIVLHLPHCATGQTPNFTVDESQPAQPLTKNSATSPDRRIEVFGTFSNGDSSDPQPNDINDSPAPPHTLLLQFREADGTQGFLVSDAADSPTTGADLAGSSVFWPATFAGCVSS